MAFPVYRSTENGAKRQVNTHRTLTIPQFGALLFGQTAFFCLQKPLSQLGWLHKLQ
jgi:hypothetical protein